MEQITNLRDALAVVIGYAELGTGRKDAKAIQRDLGRIADLLPTLRFYFEASHVICPFCYQKIDGPTTHTKRLSN